MKRRDFISSVGLVGSGLLMSAAANAQAEEASSEKHSFQLKYAPHFGMFQALAGKDPLDQLKFAADHGFRAWEDNGMKGRSVQEQEAIAKTMDSLGIQMGVFVANQIDWNKPTLTLKDKNIQETFVKQIKESVEVAKRVNAKWMTVVPGHVDLRQEMDYQTANVVDNLRRGAEVLEPHGLVIVLEPLNWWSNHPGMFLERIPQAYQICRAVDSPSCKILFDIYHQQISEGNLIPNIDKAWSEIGYFQTGDNPGRNEPGTGEINYLNVFKHIHNKGFEGILGMEHGKSKPGKEGEQAVIDAYIRADSF